jgi:hypothetical protein
MTSTTPTIPALPRVDREGDVWLADYGEAWSVLAINGPDLVLESVDAALIGGCRITLIDRKLIAQHGRRLSLREAMIRRDPLGFAVARDLLPWLLNQSGDVVATADAVQSTS